MGEDGRDPGDHHETDTEPPLTVELLADLQAGLLDDDSAARVRNRLRADPAAATVLDGLNRVRRDIAALRAQAPPPPEVAPAVVARITAALRSADRSHPGRRRAVHAARAGHSPARVIAAVTGLAAAVAAAGIGTAALITSPAPMPSDSATVRHVTVWRAAPAIPLSDPQILALLHQRPDYGPLRDAQRRGSCLTGLGYPVNVRVLGAQPVQVDGRSAVLLVLPDDTPQTVAALAVASTCSSADTGLLASRLVHRP